MVLPLYGHMKQKCCPATELIQLPELWRCQAEVYMGYIPFEHLLTPTPFYYISEFEPLLPHSMWTYTPEYHASQCAHPSTIVLLVVMALTGEHLELKTEDIESMVFVLVLAGHFFAVSWLSSALIEGF